MIRFWERLNLSEFTEISVVQIRVRFSGTCALLSYGVDGYYTASSAMSIHGLSLILSSSWLIRERKVVWPLPSLKKNLGEIAGNQMANECDLAHILLRYGNLEDPRDSSKFVKHCACPNCADDELVRGVGHLRTSARELNMS